MTPTHAFAGLTLGVDCCQCFNDTWMLCGARADFARFVGAPPQIVGVFCVVHRRAGDARIPRTVPRAPASTVLRAERFVEPA